MPWKTTVQIIVTFDDGTTVTGHTTSTVPLTSRKLRQALLNRVHHRMKGLGMLTPPAWELSAESVGLVAPERSEWDGEMSQRDLRNGALDTP